MPPKHAFNAGTILDQGRVSQDLVDKLKEWSKTQKLPVLSDEQLVLFLLSCRNNLDASKSTIHSYFKHKSSTPEFFSTRDYYAEDIQRVIEYCQISVLPKRTNVNDAIIVLKLRDTSLSGPSLEWVLKMFVMVAELPLYQDPPDEIIVIIDMKGVSLLHLLRAGFIPLLKFVRYLQEGFLCKLKQIHVFNTVYFIDKILMVVKPVMKKELYNMIKFHSTNMNMNKFFEQYLPMDCVPEDYGGTLPSQDILSAQTNSMLQDMKRFYQDEEEQIQEYKSLQYCKNKN